MHILGIPSTTAIIIAAIPFNRQIQQYHINNINNNIIIVNKSISYAHK